MLEELERLGADPLPDLSSRRVVLALWHPRVCKLSTRFYPDEILRIHHHGGFPDTIVLDNRGVEEGTTALAIFMARLATPSRYFDLSQVFGRETSTIGRICWWVQGWIYENWGPLLRWSAGRYSPEVLESFAEALVDLRDAPLDNCVGFVDGEFECLEGDVCIDWSYFMSCMAGTVWRISRPSYNQREFYNGHKRVHSLKYQAIVTPE